MLSNQIDHSSGAYPPDPCKTLSIPLFHYQQLRYFIAMIILAIFLLVSTSYMYAPDTLKQNDLEYFAPASVDSLKNFLSDQSAIDNPAVNGEGIINIEIVSSFYQLSGYRPVWTHARGLTRRAESLIDLIGQARCYGLEPSHYHLSAIEELREEISLKHTEHTEDLKTNFEILMTDAALAMMTNLRAGYTAYDSVLLSKEWFPTLPAVLYRGIVEGQLQQEILSLQPGFNEYQRLQRATAKFVQASRITDEWPEITYPANDSQALQQQIRKALIALGYLNRNHQDDLTEALKVFQHYHGLAADGKTGSNTVEALQQSTLLKYRKLALNLDRLRKQGIADSSLLYVNIPSYQLKIIRNNMVVDTFRVIVGHPSSPTPQLDGNMETIIVNPVWFVPRSITLNEILPRIKSDSGYLSRNGFEILDGNYKTVRETSLNLEELSADNFDYTLRQGRGSENALGCVKFIFSNPYSIYIHDTPGKGLFNKDIRAFSHGCIRLKDPERLASYIVREINSDKSDLNEMIRDGHHYEIDIRASLPVHIRYITCEADEAGNVYFYKDIYRLDEKELQTLLPMMGI